MSQVTLPASPGSRPAQNWILGPWQDAVLIIAAPALALFWTAGVKLQFGTGALMFVFGILNVAHHYPTFLRIYGDRALLKRFRWSLLLGPLVPMTLYITIARWLLSSGYGMKSLLLMYLILILWDPWHFLMQHYGFMRIYDRNNQAPRKLSARMDMMLCWTWFGHMMVAAVDWLPNLLYMLRLKHGINLLGLFDSGVMQSVIDLTFALAVVTTVVYAGYLVWCYRNGYYVSLVKLLLAVITFGVMWITYVPNPLILRAIPDWSFTLGFVTIGFGHIAQYLAIVWKYNRSLATRADAARSGVFQSSFARGGFIIGVLYFLACATWGFFFSEEGMLITLPVIRSMLNNEVFVWITIIAMAAGFTSTLLHYYYDGFIWKVRHNENRRNLALDNGNAETASKSLPSEDGEPSLHSWWHRARRSTIGTTLWKQGLYFGVPMLFITISYQMASDVEADVAESRFQAALRFAESGIPERSQAEARAALQAVDNQVTVERQMLEIQHRAQHLSYLAELYYLRSRIQTVIGDRQAADKDLGQAIAAMEQAIEAPGTIAHERNDKLTRPLASEVVQAWGKELSAGNRENRAGDGDRGVGNADSSAGIDSQEPEADRQLRRKLIGVWTQRKYGNRTLTISDDGSGLMIIEPEAFYAVLYGSKLTFNMYWKIKDGVIDYGYRTGTPADKVKMAAETIGDHWIEKIIELTEKRLVLLEKDGQTKSIWDRKTAAADKSGS